MKPDTILDFDEYYNDDEQMAYDHGKSEGEIKGSIMTLLLIIAAIVVSYFLGHLSF